MEILTRKELEVRLNASNRAILAWQKLGMPYFVLPKSRTEEDSSNSPHRYILEEVIEWMKARTKEGGEQ